MNEYEEKIEKNLFNLIKHLDKPKILELGVQSGVSTNKFLEICDNNDGYLYSVDVDDCSSVAQNKRWRFIKSRDDEFDYIKSIIPKKLNVIFIDTLHEAAHVNKIIYNYYEQLEEGGYIFVDDVSHLPYLNENKKSSFYCEINNKETFENILEIYYNNQDCFDLNFSFKSSGLAIIKKKNNSELKPNSKLKSRQRSLKYLIRKIWLLIRKSY
jgi:predicted O-methyltransferase YrrM|tara:strand:+ start:67 stop:702 length:636 start_codon:yes stop_codon:yes gene_type:complete